MNQQNSEFSSIGKPSFTTFGYNSEYALEDILKSGVYDFEVSNMEDVEKAIAKRGAKRRRAKLPSYSQEDFSSQQYGKDEDLKGKEASASDKDAEKENNWESEEGKEEEEEEEGADSQFQQLYEELQSCATGQGLTDSGPLTYQFEKIYEDLAIVGEGSPPASSSSSYLPPEIYRMHTESHSARMGILTKYVETGRSYSSLASSPPEVEEPIYDIWSPGEVGGWCTVGGGGGSPFPTAPTAPQSPFANTAYMANSPFSNTMMASPFPSPELTPLSMFAQSHTERLDFIPARSSDLSCRRTISLISKNRKNCECCPGHSLIVNH